MPGGAGGSCATEASWGAVVADADAGDDADEAREDAVCEVDADAELSATPYPDPPIGADAP